MNPFAPTLKTIYDSLDLPQPEKSRILLEISGDMEDCYHNLLDSGLGEKAALQQTEERFRLDARTLQALIQIHMPPIKRLMDRFSRQAQSRWEKTLLLLLLCIILAFSGPDLISMQMIRDAGKYAWPVLSFALVGMFVFLYKLYHLNLKQSYEIRRVRDGMIFLLFLGGAGVMTGIVGTCTETVCFLRDAMIYSDHILKLLVHLLMRNSALMTMGILNAIFMGIGWFILMRKIEDIEQSEVRILLKLK